MKLLVSVLILACFANNALGQGWSRRWSTRSSWYSYPSGGLDGSFNTWPTRPTGRFDNTWTTMPTGRFDNTWSTMPTGRFDNTWTTRPAGWTGNWDNSWYSWYSWYSWQGAPSVGAGSVQPPSTWSPSSDNSAPPRPNLPFDSRPENTATGPTGPRNANQRSRPRPISSRNKRDVVVATNNDGHIVPIENQIRDSEFDAMTRDPRRSAVNKMVNAVEANPADLKCPNTHRPVCGTNNRTYGNPCELMKAGYEDECLDFAYDGECTIDKEIVCFDCQEEDAKLGLTKKMLQLTGFDDWFAYNMAVCGTDGNTYISMCDLCKRKCLDANEQLRPEHRGHCGAPFPFVGGN